MKAVLTIAGSDSSGGAGIQADIKTMTVNGVFAMSAVTALTAQNTMGVRSVMEVSPQFLAEQIDAVFEDIRPDAVKIGMVSSPELAEVIAERLIYHKAQNIVTDPVAVATSGSALSTSDAYEAVKKRLFPISAVITPPVDHIQAYTIRELIVRIEHGANIAEAKRRIKEAITHILSIPSNKNVKIITDVDC